MMHDVWSFWLAGSDDGSQRGDQPTQRSTSSAQGPLAYRWTGPMPAAVPCQMNGQRTGPNETLMVVGRRIIRCPGLLLTTYHCPARVKFSLRASEVRGLGRLRFRSAAHLDHSPSPNLPRSARPSGSRQACLFPWGSGAALIRFAWQWL